MSLDPTASSDVIGECVHTVWDYYDGPREGIADFRGRPHVYKCQFSQSDDDWTDRFWLMEIDQPLLGLAKEQFAMFLRWAAEFKLGNVSIDSHPVLSEERGRYDELVAIIGDRLQLQPERSITGRALFSSDGLTVQWAMP